MERLEIFDSRLFLSLPEHASQANHIWNCALFLTQMSHLNNQISQQQQLLPNSSGTVAHHSLAIDTTDITPSTENNAANLACFESILSELKYNLFSSQNSRSSNENNNSSYVKLINETIANVIKIKKRNKASYFNLNVLHFSQKMHVNRANSATDNESKQTMPWLFMEIAVGDEDIQANVNSKNESANNIECKNNLTKSCENSSENNTDYDEDEEEEDDDTSNSERINESDELSTPRFDHGCKK